MFLAKGFLNHLTNEGDQGGDLSGNQFQKLDQKAHGAGGGGGGGHGQYPRQ